MIQVALFKKKNQQENPTPVAETEFDYKTEVLKALNEKLNGTLYDGCIIMPRGFTIDVRIGRHEEKDEIKLLQVLFIVEHEDFDEPLIDPIDSQGRTDEEAVKTAAEIFFAGVWHPLDQSMFKKNPIHIPVTYLNQHYDFDMYAQSIVRIGPKNEKATMLVGFIKNEIPKYLGSKKYYWLRIYLAKHKDKAVVEVRVNGSVCNELGEFFKGYVSAWDASESFICEKQCAIFVQREEDKCPFNKETVTKTAHAAIERMIKCTNHDEYMEMARELDEIAGDRSVAAEVRIFIPEILAKITLGYSEGDSLFLIEGENKIEFKKTQLRSYFYIQQVLLEYLNTRPPKEDVHRIVFNSVAYRELKKASENGHKPEDLYVPGTAYSINNDDYQVW